MIHFRKVSSDVQIKELVHLAREIWQEHYLAIVGQGQVDYMLEKFQSERAVAEQIAEGYEYYSVVCDECVVGYVAIVTNLDDIIPYRKESRN